MSRARLPLPNEPGPFRLEQVPEGSRYELSDGHPIYCSPAGRDHGRPHAIGALPLGTDPAVRELGTDVGHVLGEHTLRAPDLSVGALVEGEGAWAQGAPPLAVEYAAQGQDEADLQKKIGELLGAGARFVWVVRLQGPRRVEVYQRGRKVRVKQPGERLEAPGVLKNAVPVEALFDQKAAFEHALQNLLERAGYAGLEAVREEGLREGEAKGLREGKEEGEAKGLRVAVLDLCEAFGIEPTPTQRERLAAMGVDELEALRQQVKRSRRWPLPPDSRGWSRPPQPPRREMSRRSFRRPRVMARGQGASPVATSCRAARPARQGRTRRLAEARRATRLRGATGEAPRGPYALEPHDRNRRPQCEKRLFVGRKNLRFLRMAAIRTKFSTA
jgi:Uma2 family endonuclease